jgi:poly-gamma-glutamate synthesis protein (capsule biosynthesis protein)
MFLIIKRSQNIEKFAAARFNRDFLWSALATLVSLALQCKLIGGEAPFPAMFPEKEPFLRAIALEEDGPSPGRRVTGITVPHHLLALDLIARGFHACAGAAYRRVVVLSPDHFKKARRPFATCDRSFSTPLGEVRCDGDAIDTLLKACPRVEESELFASEHGIHAVLPFIAHFFPQAKIVPIALRIDSSVSDWQALVAAIEPLITADTLIVQSTDFSHYLPYRQACQHDQQTLNTIATGDPEMVCRLEQPANLDSKAAQYVQMRIQKDVNGASPEVIAQRNSQGYTSFAQASTTSYIVQVYERPIPSGKDDALPRTSAWPTYPGDRVFFFAGDTFFGRHVALKLGRPEEADKFRGAVLRVTSGAPLVVNLEGVLLAEVPSQLRNWALGMNANFAVGWLRSLNVEAVIIANNHALDFGQSALVNMKNLLCKAGIVAIADGEVADLGAFRLVALTDLSNESDPRTNRLTDETIKAIGHRNASLPLFAFMHWGSEFHPQPTEREEALTNMLRAISVGLIVGSHPHTVGPGIEALSLGNMARAFSLGNFLFDQPNPPASGALLEVRFFPGGNYALRWHAFNFFTLGKRW